MSPPRILLVDADAFFVAVARMVDPEGAGRAPLLIVGGSATGRGVVCSASYETRRFGVRSAMPMAKAVRLCPAAMCVPVPRGACSRKSREIRAVLERFTPVVEGASIDEWYLDLAGTERLYRDEPLPTTAERIREAVRAETGLTVSIGGGTSKLIAKLAVELAKPKPGTGATGVHVVAPGAEARFMERIALADLPGIGPKAQERLRGFGLTTVPDVLAQDVATLARWLGPREAAWLHDRARGIDTRVVERREEAKQMSREDTFPQDLSDDEELREELQRLATRVAADLRRAGLTARTVTVKLRDADFRTRQASRTLADPVESDRVIAAVARELLDRLRRTRRTPARLLGVALSSFGDEPIAEQLALFAGPAAAAETESEKDRVVSRVRDSLRAKFGEKVVKG